MRLPHLGLRQTHLTYPLLPVVETPGDRKCPVCFAAHLPLEWAALGLGPSLCPSVLALQKLWGSLQVHKGLGCCP